MIEDGRTMDFWILGSILNDARTRLFQAFIRSIDAQVIRETRLHAFAEYAIKTINVTAYGQTRR